MILADPLSPQASPGRLASEVTRRPVVCTLPLPGLGLWQPVGRVAGRCGRRRRRRRLSDYSHPPGRCQALRKRIFFCPGCVYLDEMSMHPLLTVLLGALLGLGFSYLSKASGFG